MLPDHRAIISVEYSVRERAEPIAQREAQPDDLHGLTKPVYTLSEAASLLGTSRSTIRQRFGPISVRLGRRVLIPRSQIIGILNGEVPLDEQHLPAPVQSVAARRHDARPKMRTVLLPNREIVQDYFTHILSNPSSI